MSDETTADDPARRVRATIRAIPAGAVLSYGQVAERAGLPRRARFVARVLRDNHDPDLPWHRVTGAGGRIAIPEASPSRAEQIRRLRAEGRTVENGRVRIDAADRRRAELPLLP